MTVALGTSDIGQQLYFSSGSSISNCFKPEVVSRSHPTGPGAALCSRVKGIYLRNRLATLRMREPETHILHHPTTLRVACTFFMLQACSFSTAGLSLGVQTSLHRSRHDVLSGL